jgi:hypothetical protein
MKNWAQAILQGVLGLAIFGAFWLGLAGRLDWWQGWVCLTAFTLFVALFAWRLASTNPDLLTERNRPGGEVPTWDQRIMRTYSLTLLIQLAVSALDSGRFRWSDMPLAVQLLGWGIVIAAGKHDLASDHEQPLPVQLGKTTAGPSSGCDPGGMVWLRSSSDVPCHRGDLHRDVPCPCLLVGVDTGDDECRPVRLSDPPRR